MKFRKPCVRCKISAICLVYGDLNALYRQMFPRFLVMARGDGMKAQRLLTKHITHKIACEV